MKGRRSSSTVALLLYKALPMAQSIRVSSETSVNTSGRSGSTTMMTNSRGIRRGRKASRCNAGLDHACFRRMLSTSQKSHVTVVIAALTLGNQSAMTASDE